MKKFLGKKPVMITFVALAIVMLVVYIGLLVRPVAVGFTYKGEITNPMDPTQKMEVSVKFKSSKKAEMAVKGESETDTVYYFEKDGYVVFLPIDKEEDYKTAKEECLKDWEATKVAVEAGMGGTDCSAFSAKVMGADLKCTGSVVFAIVGGVVELVLLAAAGLSVFYVVKKK